LPEPRHAFSLEIISPGRPSTYVNLGPHPPRLWPEDVDKLHSIWLHLCEKGPGHKLHHRDIVHIALQRLEQDLINGKQKDLLAALQQLHKTE